MSYRLQGVGKVYWRKNHSVSDCLLCSLPGYMFLIIAREGNGWAFFLTACDSVQPLDVLLKSVLYGCENWGLQLSFCYSSW